MKLQTKQLILFYVVFLIAAFCTIGAISGKPLLFDRIIQLGIHSAFNEHTYPFFKMISTIGNKKSIGIIAILVLLWLWWRKHDYAGIVLFVFALGGGKIINDELKMLIARPRPDLVHIVKVNSFSFPSGHAMTNFILYYMIAYLLMKDTTSRNMKWFIGLFCGSIIFTIGLSRVVLHVHYPTDIIGGYAIGFLWASVCIYFYNHLIKNRVNLPKY